MARSPLWATVEFTIVATVSGVIASVFAVSRMLAMLTDMKLASHSHFGISGSISAHGGVCDYANYFRRPTPIASLGAIFYIVMDMAVHWSVFGYLSKEINARASVLITAMLLDAIVLVVFLWVKTELDMLVIGRRWWACWLSSVLKPGF